MKTASEYLAEVLALEHERVDATNERCARELDALTERVRHESRLGELRDVVCSFLRRRAS